MTDPTTLEARLHRLEQNHLALAAEHTALLQFTRGMVGFMGITPEQAARRLQPFYDNTVNRLEDHYLDPADFRALFDASWQRLMAALPPGKG